MSDAVQGTIFASHHSFRVMETGKLRSRAEADWSNGLIDVQSGGVALVFTGVHTGEVAVTVELYEQVPPVNTDEWEEVVEVSFHAPHGEVHVSSLSADTETSHLFPQLTPNGAGHYRLRVHARGRDAALVDEQEFDDQELDDQELDDQELDDQELDDQELDDQELDDQESDGEEFDDEDTEPIEHYLIMVWPAPSAPEIIHKQTDAYGADLRAQATTGGDQGQGRTAPRS